MSDISSMTKTEDRRVTRTRAALVAAYNHLLLSRRRDIRVADIVAQANVGRSTFYEHYQGADDIHLQALARPFATLANAAAGDGDVTALTGLLAHFWENRQLARDSILGRMQDKVTRLLATMVEERLSAVGDTTAIPLKLAALQLAEAALAPVRGWVTAEASCTAGALATAICSAGRALRAQLGVGS